MSSKSALRRNMTERMTELGISQAELARRMACSRAYISQLRSGQSTPGLDVVDKLAEALDTTADALISQSVAA